MTGEASTPEATALIARTARHFAHKVPVTTSERETVIETRFGRAELVDRGGAISIVLTSADRESRDALREVIDSHLRRFARAPLEIQWSPALPQEGACADRST